LIELLERLADRVQDGTMSMRDAALHLYKSGYIKINEEGLRKYQTAETIFRNKYSRYQQAYDELQREDMEARKEMRATVSGVTGYADANFKHMEILTKINNLDINIKKCYEDTLGKAEKIIEYYEKIALSYSYSCIEAAIIMKYMPYKEIKIWKKVVEGSEVHPATKMKINAKVLDEYLQPLGLRVSEISGCASTISDDTYRYTSLECIGFYDYMDEHNIHSEWDKQMYSQLNYFDACRNAEINAVTDAIRTKGTLTGRFL
jgi:hypothetical protein